MEELSVIISNPRLYEDIEAYHNIVENNSDSCSLVIVDVCVDQPDLLLFEPNNNKHISYRLLYSKLYSINSICDILLLCLNHEIKSIKISYPTYEEIEFEFPVKLAKGRAYCLLSIDDPDYIEDNSPLIGSSDEGGGIGYQYINRDRMYSFDNSYNVTVYDKEGNPYTTGLLITSANGAWIRIQKDLGDYEQYPLKDADKKGFTHMTIGKSEIEPLYIK